MSNQPNNDSMNKCFKPEFTNVNWEYDTDLFTLWTEGRTGFPIVDAAMRQIKHEAWMHNRNRMVVSSFLSKDLMIDWRRGERYFMENLIDGDFASNHGGWGFGSSTGVDPQPYFRIFNPLLQSEKFDPNGDFIRKWVPELRAIKVSSYSSTASGTREILERHRSMPNNTRYHTKTGDPIQGPSRRGAVGRANH